MFSHNLLPASVIQEVKGVVWKKTWKIHLEVGREGACETGIGRLLQVRGMVGRGWRRQGEQLGVTATPRCRGRWRGRHRRRRRGFRPHKRERGTPGFPVHVGCQSPWLQGPSTSKPTFRVESEAILRQRAACMEGGLLPGHLHTPSRLAPGSTTRPGHPSC